MSKIIRFRDVCNFLFFHITGGWLLSLSRIETSLYELVDEFSRFRESKLLSTSSQSWAISNFGRGPGWIPGGCSSLETKMFRSIVSETRDVLINLYMLQATRNLRIRVFPGIFGQYGYFPTSNKFHIKAMLCFQINFSKV